MLPGWRTSYFAWSKRTTNHRDKRKHKEKNNKQNKTEQNRAKQNRTEQNRTGQTDRQTERTNRQTNKQASKQTNKQTNKHTQTWEAPIRRKRRSLENKATGATGSRARPLPLPVLSLHTRVPSSLVAKSPKGHSPTGVKLCPLDKNTNMDLVSLWCPCQPEKNRVSFPSNTTKTGQMYEHLNNHPNTLTHPNLKKDTSTHPHIHAPASIRSHPSSPRAQALAPLQSRQNTESALSRSRGF